MSTYRSHDTFLADNMEKKTKQMEGPDIAVKKFGRL